MTSNAIRALFAAVLLLCLLTAPVAAQDTTPTDEPVATQAPIPTEAPVVIEEPALDPIETANNLYILIGGLLGVSVGFSIGALASRWLSNPAEIKAIEGLTKSTPEPVAMALVEFGKTINAVGKLLIEAFDRIPAADKPSDVDALIDRRLTQTPAAKPEHFEPGRGGHGD